MSLTNSPITPRRPLYPRSMSARRASPGFSYSISVHGSPRTSPEDLTESPSVPVTPADATNARVTPKMWSASKLESISESSANGVGSDRQRFKHIEVVSGKQHRNGEFRIPESKEREIPADHDNTFINDDPFTEGVPLPRSPSERTTETRVRNDVALQYDLSPVSKKVVTFQGTVITDENAQALLPPGACIFVANLPRDISDTSLHEQVKIAFSKFGDCWVKIRRNNNSNTPHAFVQYANAENASKALALGRTERIGGRTCRTEMAVAPRILFVFRKDRTAFSRSVIHELLSSIGEIAEIAEPSLNEQASCRLPYGYFVKMAIYQAALSSIAAYRQNPIWNVVPHDVVVPTRKDPTRAAPPAKHRSGNSLPGNHHLVPTSVGSLYECLWVGEIPLGATFYAFIRLLLSQGPIHQIETRIFIDPGPTKCMAWVWFSQPGLVSNAAQALNGLRFHDCIIQAQYAVRSPQGTGPGYIAGGTPPQPFAHVQSV